MILGERNRLNPELTDHLFPSEVDMRRFVAVEAVKVELVRTRNAFDSGHTGCCLHSYRTTNPSGCRCCCLSQLTILALSRERSTTQPAKAATMTRRSSVWSAVLGGMTRAVRPKLQRITYKTSQYS